MNPEKYVSYNLSDFAEDEVFIDWVIHEDEELENFWMTFLEKYPEKKDTLESARSLILASRKVYAAIKLSEQEKEMMNEQILNNLHKVKPIHTPQRPTLPSWFSWAAVILLICAIGGAIYTGQRENIKLRHATTYGEIESFVLPDGSRVKLHANSRILFDEVWEEGNDREVWLDGEAYFEVEKKLESKAKFTVHTQDLKVEVLGTEFNVDTRKGKTEVVLNEGSIKLKLEDKRKQTILMQPGDLVSFSQKQNKLDKRKVNSEVRISWKEGIQQFDKAPLKEIIDKIEEIYGIEIAIQDSSLFSRNLTIGVPVENLEIALGTLETLLGKNIAPSTENHFRIK